MTDFGTSNNNNSHPAVRKVPTTYKVNNDPFIFRVALSTLALVTVVGMISISVMAFLGTEIPQAITAVTSASLGALTALFTRR